MYNLSMLKLNDNKTGGQGMTNSYTHLVDMKTSEGCILHGLEANMDSEGNIYFVRDDDGVNAWYCGVVHKNDWNVVKITQEA